MLSLDDRPIIDSFLKALGLSLSEYSFANLYLFREVHQYQFSKNPFPHIKGITRDQLPYIMPLVPPPFETKDVLFPIPEEWLSFFPDSNCVALEKDQDYLFTLEKMRTYSGRKLQSKRNLLYKFADENEIRLEPITPANSPSALKVLDTWQKESGQDDTDYSSAKEALALLEPLQLKGCLFFAGTEPVGFLICETLIPTVEVIHFAKGIDEYKGVYAYMYQSLAKSLPDTVQWINLEQDLGLPELAQAKHSFQPDLLLPKYRITPQ